MEQSAEIAVISGGDFIDIATLGAEDAARVGHVQAVKLDQIDAYGYAKRGLLAKEFHDRLLWQHVPGANYASWTAWMKDVFRHSHTSTHESLRMIRLLEADIPTQTLAELDSGALRSLAKVSTATRKLPEVLEASKSMRPQKFEAYLASEHPSEHIETTKFLNIALPESEMEILLDAREKAKEIHPEAVSASQQVLRIAQHYTQCEQVEQEAGEQ